MAALLTDYELYESYQPFFNDKSKIAEASGR